MTPAPLERVGVRPTQKKILIIMHNVNIKPIIIANNYDLISSFMRSLHENEKSLFDKTADWNDIEVSYMRHITEMQEDNDGTCLVAYIDDVPAGFIFGYTEEQDDSRIEVYTGKELYVSDGYVVPDFRRKGLYKMLNEKLESIYIAKGIKRIIRFTLSNNTKMQSFLEQDGYKPTRLLYEKWL